MPLPRARLGTRENARIGILALIASSSCPQRRGEGGFRQLAKLSTILLDREIEIPIKWASRAKANDRMTEIAAEIGKLKVRCRDCRPSSCPLLPSHLPPLPRPPRFSRPRREAFKSKRPLNPFTSMQRSSSEKSRHVNARIARIASYSHVYASCIMHVRVHTYVHTCIHAMYMYIFRYISVPL